MGHAQTGEAMMARYEIAEIEAAALGQAPANADAFFELGMMYSSGRSVPIDLVSAHKWFNIAAMKGCADAARLRREIAAEMSDSEIGTAQHAAREWLKLHPQMPVRIELPLRVAA
jgi:TPR repeat protein